MHAEVNTDFALVGGVYNIHTLQEQAIMAGNPPIASRSGIKKVFPRRALHDANYCERDDSGDTNLNVQNTS